MELKDKTLEELKVLAYDQIVLLEQTQRNLQIINQAIAEKNKPTTEK